MRHVARPGRELREVCTYVPLVSTPKKHRYLLVRHEVEVHIQEVCSKFAVNVSRQREATIN